MTDIGRMIRESGQALLRHWSQIGPHLALDGTNLLGDDSPLAELLDAGAGIDFFVAYRGGQGIGGIATRAQWDGVYPTISWRNRSSRSELSRCCTTYLAHDNRLRPDWSIHLYENVTDHHLHGFVAARADQLARYYLDGHPVGHRTNGRDRTPFVAFDVNTLRHFGVDARDAWFGVDPYQGELW